ncbi:DUF4418 family protein [Sporomusa acidovorans]|uniref:DUF4418 domain-containing protein n=1 Tax=Sporomusa acidovorans (strain ATCC 49682 / DSM 3132 / Mol) TaxID=1123286 RepID=A0ABZ3JAJ3_SPOA4|nr:DUF4418 family protein [Sporomusa acidovorans]OZC21769.1 hypothetical protein SPACI_18440 [Sporomusa acidovorans DSM 3132]SDD57381.1 protein of unknown function [Sporomusa acidovorans]
MSKEYKQRNLRLNHGLGWLALVFSLALFTTPILFPICQGLMETKAGMPIPMKCHWSYRIETVLAMLGIGLSGLYFWVKNAEVKKYFGLGFLIIGLLVIFVPTNLIIGVCNSAKMPCRATTSWMWTWGGLLVLTGLSMIVYWHQQSQAEKRLPGAETGGGMPPGREV